MNSRRYVDLTGKILTWPNQSTGGHNQKSMQRLLEANGWTATVGGKHQVKMTKPGHRPITLPMNHGRDYPVGLAVAIMRQAGLRGRDE